MIKDFTPSVIAFAGDWHGNINWAKNAIALAKQNGADCIVQLGDFGYWPRRGLGRDFLAAVSRRATKYDMPVFWLDGNHEDHESLLQVPVDEKTGLRETAEGVYQLPRGHRWTWGGVRFMALGGAASVDKGVRTPGVDWFPEEELTYAQAIAAADSGEVDVLLTHDTIPFVPSVYSVPSIPPDSFWPQEAMVRSHAHQQLVGQVVEATAPTHLLHGHFHSRYVTNYTTEQLQMLIIGLDCDGGRLDRNMMMISLDELAADVHWRRLELNADGAGDAV